MNRQCVKKDKNFEKCKINIILSKRIIKNLDNYIKEITL